MSAKLSMDAMLDYYAEDCANEERRGGNIASERKQAMRTAILRRFEQLEHEALDASLATPPVVSPPREAEGVSEAMVEAGIVAFRNAEPLMHYGDSVRWMRLVLLAALHARSEATPMDPSKDNRGPKAGHRNTSEGATPTGGAKGEKYDAAFWIKRLRQRGWVHASECLARAEQAAREAEEKADSHRRAWLRALSERSDVTRERDEARSVLKRAITIPPAATCVTCQRDIDTAGDDFAVQYHHLACSMRRPSMAP